MPSCTVSPVFSRSSRSLGRASFATSMRRRTSAPSSKSATPRRYLPFSVFCSRKPALVSVAASRCTVLFARRKRVASVVMPSSFSSPENDVKSRMEFATDDSRARGGLVLGARSIGEIRREQEYARGEAERRRPVLRRDREGRQRVLRERVKRNGEAQHADGDAHVAGRRH